jgi:hypothetical protein
MAFVILFLSPFLSFSGTVHVPVNQALAQRQGNEKPLPLAPHFSAIIPCKHLEVRSVYECLKQTFSKRRFLS